MNNATRVMELMDTDFDYPVVSPEHTISQAWHVLGTYSQNGSNNNSERLVLVTNRENQLEGVINLETIFENMEPGDFNMIARVPGGGVGEVNYLVACLLPRHSITEIMLPVDKIALKSTDTVNKALILLLNNDVGVLPVLNIFKHLIGIVHAADVFYALGLSSSFCKLAFPGYDYSRHGVFNLDYVNQNREFNYELPEKKQKLPGCLLHRFNLKIAIIAVLVGLMLSLLTTEMIRFKVSILW